MSHYYRYYLVLGTTHSICNLFEAVKLIKSQLIVHQMSEVYRGPSEDVSKTDKEFFNLALSCSNERSFDSIKHELSLIEQLQLHQNKKIVDIDLLIQLHQHSLLYISPKVTRFCHCLITLKDICPDLKISENKLVQDYFYSNKNKQEFTSVTLS